MPVALLSLPVRHDQDVVISRRRAAELASLLGFDSAEQTRLATAVSEIVRNAFRYAKDAVVTFSLDRDLQPQAFIAEVTDRGPGIPHLDDVLMGRYRSSTGMG